MDLTQMRHFLALANALNFTRAAERCYITQPAFTRSTQRLEDGLGGPLVQRERALTQLTVLGRAILPLLQGTHDAAEAVRARAADHRRAVDAAPLRLGLAPSVPTARGEVEAAALDGAAMVAATRSSGTGAAKRRSARWWRSASAWPSRRRGRRCRRAWWRCRWCRPSSANGGAERRRGAADEPGGGRLRQARPRPRGGSAAV